MHRLFRTLDRSSQQGQPRDRNQRNAYRFTQSLGCTQTDPNACKRSGAMHNDQCAKVIQAPAMGIQQSPHRGHQSLRRCPSGKRFCRNDRMRERLSASATLPSPPAVSISKTLIGDDPWQRHPQQFPPRRRLCSQDGQKNIDDLPRLLARRRWPASCPELPTRKQRIDIFHVHGNMM